MIKPIHFRRLRIYLPHEGAFNILIQFKAWQDANVIGLDGL